MNSRNLLSLLLALVCLPALAKSPLELSIKSDTHEIEATFKGQKILVYTFAPSQFKPYVRELYTLRGDNILRDSPPDHFHHHGFMYAIRINGTNFWEEKPAPGIEKPIKLLSHKVGTSPSGLPQATFTQLIHWVPPQDAKSTDKKVALLIERRTVTLTVNEAQDEVAVQWHGDFQVGSTTKSVTLQGTIYNGLGLRLPISFDHVATVRNSESTPFKNHEAPAARWSSISGKIGEREITAALFSNAANPGESRFFSMVDPFAYLSGTQNLLEKPLDYHPGEKFSLDYLLTVYPSNKSSESLQQRLENWKQKSK